MFLCFSKPGFQEGPGILRSILKGTLMFYTYYIYIFISGTYVTSGYGTEKYFTYFVTGYTFYFCHIIH